MGLRLGRTSPRKGQLVATLIAVFVLVAQPTYGVLSAQIALAFKTENETTSAVVVRDGDPHDWTATYEQSGGEINYVADTGAPQGKGALQLITSSNTSSKATYTKNVTSNLQDISNLSYYTKQISSPAFAAGLPSYQMGVCLKGAAQGCDGFTTLVYEPYVSAGNDAVINNVWQKWDVSQGKFYSTRAIGSLLKSEGSSAYTLDQITAEFPNAYVFSISLNIGSNNPSYSTLVDSLVFDNTVYDFEPIVIDNSAPSITNIRVSPLANKNTGGSKVTVTFNATDQTGVDHVRSKVLFSGGANTEHSKAESDKQSFTHIADNEYKVVFDVDNFVEDGHMGEYDLNFNPYDINGKQSSFKPSAWQNITIDNAAPLVEMTGVITEDVQSATMDLEFEVVDSSGVRGVNIHLLPTSSGDAEKQIIALTQGEGDKWYVNDTDIRAMKDGVYSIVSRATDVFGTTRVGAGTNHGKVIIDNTGPEAPIITAPGVRTWHKASPITATWTESRDENGIKKYEVEYVYEHKGETKIIIRDAGNHLSRKQTLTGSVQGKFTIRVRAIDSVDNIGAWSKPVYYYYDNKNPFVEIGAPKASEFASIDNDILTIDGIATDNVSLNRVLVQLLNSQHGVIKNRTVYLSGTSSNWKADFNLKDLNVFDGQYAVVVTGVDKAGNTYKTEYVNFKLDNTKPAIIVDDFDNVINVQDNSLTKLKIMATDAASNIAQVQYKLRDANGQNIEGLDWKEIAHDFNGEVDVSALNSNGVYTLSLRAFDNAGNKRTGVDRTFTIDRLPPMSSEPIAVEQPVAGALATELKSAVEGADSYKWTASDDGVLFASDSAPETLVTVPTIGTYNFTLTAKDQAGNEWSEKVTVTFNAIPDNTDGNNPVTEGEVGDADESGTVALVTESPSTPSPLPAAFSFGFANNTFTPGNSSAQTPASNSDESEASDNDTAVLGTQDSAGSPLANTGAIAPSESGWNIFGMAWYWWIVAIGALMAAWLAIAAAIRRRRAEA